MKLTDEQVAAIEFKGNLVITACPGSGKTTVMAEKIRNVLDGLRRHQGVVAITFTRKASKELEQRCRRGGKDTAASFFGTIDAFCLSEIIFPFASHVFSVPPASAEPKFRADLSAEELALVKSIEDTEGKLCSENFESYLPVLEKLFSMGCVFFDSISYLANHILSSSDACKRYLRARFVAVYVDEYQDSSALQHQLFLLLLEQCGLLGVCVGDVQQSIYGWREGSPEFIRELIISPRFTHMTIGKNHRCHSSITNYANRLYDPHCALLEGDEITVYRCEIGGDELEAASKLNTIIPQLAKRFSVSSNSKIVILTRSNKGLERLRDKLTLPCIIYTDDELALIESKNSRLWRSLLSYRFNVKLQANDIIMAHALNIDVNRDRLKKLRAVVRHVREVALEQLVPFLLQAAKTFTGNEAAENEISALVRVTQDRELLSQYHPSGDHQVQCMTLHKSKGLEFDVVIHLDLVEWSIPFQVLNGNPKTVHYPSLEQDLNLHYVGITRAKLGCVLVSTTKRFNAKGIATAAKTSCFFDLPGLGGLFKQVRK
ncbi:ATP-dependent DNA helicase Rep [Pseudomonas fluorescens]|uniref:DNA 3'-5' helicase n=1 Tax=Pseudomonas fluorescens TaxID=294 RepID=A0A5E6YM97_PSEFL|nr:ATP-dependent helicase [Pseudomonas fluorescens]VVN53919.1 ATP-dependent DNA helicase Rep [Pseudomonas fluorescens]